MNLFSWKSCMITYMREEDVLAVYEGPGSLHVTELEKNPIDNHRTRLRVGTMTSMARRGLVGNQAGGIEGLPLQLLIMVVVAGLGLTIIMGWMNSIAAPHSIGDVFVTPSEITVFDDDGDGVYTNDGVAITVTVTDEKGDRLEGATVVLEGANVKGGDGAVARGVTNSNGQVLFQGLNVESFGSKLTTVTVTVAKGDYGIDSSYEIPIIPS